MVRAPTSTARWWDRVSGGLSGLPITGVIVRSSTNVAAGARSRVSTILHGV
ncbi:SulP family inorganic anion transporter [Saccharopolyspora flava]|uniref:SulP family inorganic anion transporter n=2 Tax=Saccharopolyspora TaxID=1835 RepID=UPI003CCC1C0D